MSTFLAELTALIESVKVYKDPEAVVGTQSLDEVVLGTIKDHYTKALYTLTYRFGKQKREAISAAVLDDNPVVSSDIQRVIGIANSREEACLKLFWESVNGQYLGDARARGASGLGVRRGWKVVAFREEDCVHRSMMLEMLTGGTC